MGIFEEIVGCRFTLLVIFCFSNLSCDIHTGGDGSAGLDHCVWVTEVSHGATKSIHC